MNFEKMDFTPKPGEIMLYVSLHEVENLTPWETLKLAESLGFTPELRCLSWEENGQEQFGVCALLHYEKRDYEAFLETPYITDSAFETLSKQIVPDIAVRFAYRLKQGRQIPVAA